ncbi:mechanosensitive ion channel domain-containing protein [Chelativorans sp. YIM 93263]|uniref:mechanosensitive ion channel domain-containing protein n=1 Tax=Chelativorans sp. YIM 93263 TaxID=2906648 RepID=UPI0023781CC8|nr:mechanosensitive ion channel domain-containing protein [Chelativorans sp. YIM 93263]
MLVSPALAQSNPGQVMTGGSADVAASDADVDALIRVLEDDQARERLLERLREADPQAQPDNTSILLASEQAIAHQIAAYARGAVAGTVDLIRAVIEFGHHATDIATGNASVDTHHIWVAVRDVALVVGITFAVFTALRVIFRRFQGTMARAATAQPDMIQRAGPIVLSAAADLLTVLLAWAAGYLPTLYAGWSDQIGSGQAHFLSAFLFIELAKAAARVLLAPKWPGLRFTRLEDTTAAYWYFWLSRLVSIVGYTFLFLAPLLAVDVSAGAADALRVVVVSCALAMACLIILQNRDAVRLRLMRLAENGQPGPLTRVVVPLSRIWHIAAIGYLLMVFILWLVEHEAALPFVLFSTLESLAAIAAGVVLSLAISRIAERGMRLPPDVKARLPLLERRLNAFVPNVLRVVRVVIAVSVLLVMAQIWSVADLIGWLSSEFGQRIATALVSAALILLLGALIHLAIHSWIEYRLNPEYGRVPSPRERTLLALFRNAFSLALAVIITMLVLSELGVNIGPLLAGAGIIGLAVGFGAQKLVQDIINGAFIQFENALNEGDVVTVGGVTGAVERLTIRSVSLRTLDGAYHLVPFSSVEAVANFTRNFSYHVAMIRVDYQENISEVKLAMQEAFERLKAGEAGQHVIGNLEMHGVTEFGDSSIIVRARIMTAPGQQWALGRAYNEIIKEVFDERGIEIPLPHYAIHLSRGAPALQTPLPPAGSEDQAGGGHAKRRATPGKKRRGKTIEQDGPAAGGETEV